MWSIGITAGIARCAGHVGLKDVARTKPACWTTDQPADQGVALKSPAIIAGSPEAFRSFAFPERSVFRSAYAYRLAGGGGWTARSASFCPSHNKVAA
jgi:hypothetical protein